jgi:hypothetical protein
MKIITIARIIPVILWSFAVIFQTTACEPYFQLSITNITGKELAVSVTFDWGQQYSLGTIAPGKTIKKSFDFIWSMPKSVTVQAVNDDGLKVFERSFSYAEISRLKYSVIILQDSS